MKNNIHARFYAKLLHIHYLIQCPQRRKSDLRMNDFTFPMTSTYCVYGLNWSHVYWVNQVHCFNLLFVGNLLWRSWKANTMLQWANESCFLFVVVFKLKHKWHAILCMFEVYNICKFDTFILFICCNMLLHEHYLTLLYHDYQFLCVCWEQVRYSLLRSQWRFLHEC